MCVAGTQACQMQEGQATCNERPHHLLIMSIRQLMRSDNQHCTLDWGKGKEIGTFHPGNTRHCSKCCLLLRQWDAAVCL